MVIGFIRPLSRLSLSVVGASLQSSSSVPVKFSPVHRWPQPVLIDLFSSGPRSRRSHQVLCEYSPTDENVQRTLHNDLFDIKSLINPVGFVGDYLNVDPGVPCANGVV